MSGILKLILAAPSDGILKPTPVAGSQTRLINNVVSSEWADPANAFLENDLCTSTKTDDAFNIYSFLNNLFSIPAGATITGLKAVFRWGGDGGDKFHIRLRDRTHQWGGYWGTPPARDCDNAALVSAGGDGYLWGGSWTAEHINGGDFQCRIHYVKSGKANLMYIDYIEITVYYA